MNESDHLLYSHSLQEYAGGIEEGGGARRAVALKEDVVLFTVVFA